MVKTSWLVGAATCHPHDRRESLHEYPVASADGRRLFAFWKFVAHLSGGRCSAWRSAVLTNVCGHGVLFLWEAARLHSVEGLTAHKPWPTHRLIACCNGPGHEVAFPGAQTRRGHPGPGLWRAAWPRK